MRSLTSKLFVAGTLGLILLVVIGFLGAVHPAFDTLSHARVHLSGLLAVSAILLSIFSCRDRRLALVSYLVAFVAFASAVNGYPVSAKVQLPEKGRPTYSLLHFNILWSNKRKDELIDWIKEVRPDFISITEASRRWKRKLTALDGQWPYKLDCDDREIRGGLIIYSRLPFVPDSAFCSKLMVYGSVKINIDDNAQLELASTHFRWPWPRAGARQVTQIAPTFEKLGNATVLAGDFNATPWSHQVRYLAETGHLTIVPGIGPSWLFGRVPEWLAGIVGLPIDHAMVGENIRVLEAQRGPRSGSDHFPYVMKFQVLK